jgi:CRP/FNR family transcriptional regulator, cyclic AMP receptor protein
MPNWDATAHIMAENGWLSLTPPAFRSAILQRCRLQDVRAGDTIYRVGDPPGGMYGLVSGGLGVSVAPGESGPYMGHLARPGTWFGEAAAITRQPRRVGLTVTRDAALLHLPLAKIDEIVAADPAAWRLFALVTLGHLDTAIGACDDLMRRDHVQRCVAVLLRLAGCRRAPATPNDIDLPQEDIATLANVARTTAGAILRDLENTGLLQRSYRRIRITSPEALRAMLDS